MKKIEKFANYYLNLGICVIDIVNDPTLKNSQGNYLKVPSKESFEVLAGVKDGSWHEFDLDKYQTRVKEMDWTQASGIGALLGVPRDNLLCLDFDYCSDFRIVENILKILGLPNDYEWVVKTGSGLGYHIIVENSLSEFQELIEYNCLTKNLERFDPILYYLKTGGMSNDHECYIPRGVKQDEVESPIDFWIEQPHLVESFSTTTKIVCFNPKSSFLKECEKFELIWSNYCILPPSSHKVGYEYAFKTSNSLPVKRPIKVTSIDLLKALDETSDLMPRDDVWEVSYNMSFVKEEWRNYRGRDEVLNKNEKLFMVIDCETTGLIPEGTDFYDDNMPELIQISWIITDGKKIRYKDSSCISNIKSTIGQEVVDLTGVDNNLCNKIGRPIEVVLGLLEHDLKIVKHVVGYNLDFDLNILKSEYFKIGKSVPFIGHTEIDLMLIAQRRSNEISGYVVDSYLKLSKMLEIFFVNPVEGMHNSFIDTFQTYRLFKVMKDQDLV